VRRTWGLRWSAHTPVGDVFASQEDDIVTDSHMFGVGQEYGHQVRGAGSRVVLAVDPDMSGALAVLRYRMTDPDVSAEPPATPAEVVRPD
jgi:hypothetical protein